MVRLDCFKVSENLASCNFYPENQNEFGSLTINPATGEMVDLREPENGCPKVYISQARAKLHKLISSKEELPKEAYAIWY